MYHCPIIWWNKKQLYAVGLRVLTRISRRRNEAVHPSPVDIAKIHSVVSGATILAQISSQRRVTAGESPMKLASLGLFREGKHNKVSSTFCWSQEFLNGNTWTTLQHQNHHALVGICILYWEESGQWCTHLQCGPKQKRCGAPQAYRHLTKIRDALIIRVIIFVDTRTSNKEKSSGKQQ